MEERHNVVFQLPNSLENTSCTKPPYFRVIQYIRVFRLHGVKEISKLPVTPITRRSDGDPPITRVSEMGLTSHITIVLPTRERNPVLLSGSIFTNPTLIELRQEIGQYDWLASPRADDVVLCSRMEIITKQAIECGLGISLGFC
ncbi:hypothetical protein AVEN_186121-1 [Araneus ventricosus]|uniref:Uncharacterized protein n=1 Tax=Araneus ventricosus TaxID=182803 RepID=A0A4Y2HDF6_ARAVE|nr:hypothetical protein AVEN_186121-1 [Araneus ventricosus]